MIVEEAHLLKMVTTSQFLTFSDWQGYSKPSGLEGKGSKGKGQDRHLATLEKPLSLPRVLRVKVYYIFQIFILEFMLVWFITQ